MKRKRIAHLLRALSVSEARVSEALAELATEFDGVVVPKQRRRATPPRPAGESDELTRARARRVLRDSGFKEVSR
jgi:hypothetical protein